MQIQKKARNNTYFVKTKIGVTNNTGPRIQNDQKYYCESHAAMESHDTNMNATNCHAPTQHNDIQQNAKKRPQMQHIENVRTTFIATNNIFKERCAPYCFHSGMFANNPAPTPSTWQNDLTNQKPSIPNDFSARLVCKLQLLK